MMLLVNKFTHDMSTANHYVIECEDIKTHP